MSASGRNVGAFAILLSVASVILLVAAVCSHFSGGSELLQTVTIGGQQYALVPVSSIGAGSAQVNQQGWASRYRNSWNKGRWAQQGLFGPGDLPMPIEDDGDYINVIPGSNVFFYEHGVPAIPHGMDDYPDPPYSIGYPSLDDPNY